MLYGHGICFLDMEYIFLIWNIISWSDVRWYDIKSYDMIWYYMMLLKTFEACVRLAAGAFFLEKTHILKKWYFRFLRKNDFCVFCVKNTTFELLNHFNEYLHVFLVNFHTGSCQNDSPMFKLWSFLILT